MEIDTQALTTCEVAADGAVSLGFVDSGGKPATIRLSLNEVGALAMTLPKLIDQALQIFFELRGFARLRKRPSTSELIDWLAALKATGTKSLKLDEHLPFLGALLKREQDLQAFAEGFAGGKRSRA